MAEEQKSNYAPTGCSRYYRPATRLTVRKWVGACWKIVIPNGAAEADPMIIALTGSNRPNTHSSAGFRLV